MKKKSKTWQSVVWGTLMIISTQAYSDRMTTYWEGTISSIAYFSQDSEMDGVVQGAKISGSLIYESDQSTGHRRIMGDPFGDEYSFSNSLLQTINIGSNEWNIRGGEIGLLWFGDVSWKAFDIFSTSGNSIYELFPKYVGHYEAGFCLIDDTAPYAIYDSNDIENMVLHYDQANIKSGHLSSRRWEDYSVVEGYYINFIINEVSASPIIEPSTNVLLGAYYLLLTQQASNNPKDDPKTNKKNEAYAEYRVANFRTFGRKKE